MPYKDPAKRSSYQNEWLKKRRLKWLLENGPCVRCGSSTDLQVDHKNAQLKVTHRLWSWSKEKRDKELAKCWVLCRSCHLTKTLAMGEMPTGERNGRAKLSEENVLKVREEHEAGTSTIRELADRYGVHKSTILKVVRGNTWKGV